MITIDGSKYEGGGQIARTALALSTITQKPFEMHSIRKGRKQPGLKNQHLYCIKALQQLSNAECEGAELGSEKITFTPNKIKSINLDIDIETAGSITLFLQALIPPCLHTPSIMTLTVIGGTDVNWSPSTDYFSRVFLPQISHLANIEYKLIQRGYYPKGNGKVEVTIRPKQPKGEINLIEKDELLHIKGISHSSRDLLNANVAERTAEMTKLILNNQRLTPIRIEYPQTDSTGSGITLFAQYSNGAILGVDVLGQRGIKSEDIGKQAAEKLKELMNSNTVVDKHLADQLIPYIALFGGQIKTEEITQHIKANIYACEQFLGNCLEIDEKNKIIKKI